MKQNKEGRIKQFARDSQKQKDADVTTPLDKVYNIEEFQLYI